MITTRITPDLVRGALELERTDLGVRLHRLPTRARSRGADAQLLTVEGQPSGVRLVFATSATRIELRAKASRVAFRGVPPRPDGVFELVVDGRLIGHASLVSADLTVIDPATGAMETTPGEVESLRFAELPPGAKIVEIWLPHNETLELGDLLTDEPVAAVATQGRVWVHHGSSISQGSNATRPTGTWPAVVARTAGVELVNLGYGGSAMLDPFVARTIAGLPADVISVKIGINLVNADLMRRRAFVPAVHGFLDTIRDGHPTAPLLVVSPLCCPIHEDTPGPGAFDVGAFSRGVLRFRASGDPAGVAGGQLTLRVIRDELRSIVADRATSDPQLFGLDGLALYGPADAEELPLPDRLHPDAAAHQRIGERFAELVFGADGPFSRPPDGRPDGQP